MLEVILSKTFLFKHKETFLQGLITGMTQYTTKAHIVRAALEGICYQTREVIDFFP